MANTELSDPATKNRLIWSTVRRIPPGRVCTYGFIADLAGLGKAARRVGRALRELPRGSTVPWHRVVRAGGYLAFAADSDAYQTQRSRLEEEGVEFRARRIDLDVYGWQCTLDELLWKPDHQAPS